MDKEILPVDKETPPVDKDLSPMDGSGAHWDGNGLLKEGSAPPIAEPRFFRVTGVQRQRAFRLIVYVALRQDFPEVIASGAGYLGVVKVEKLE